MATATASNRAQLIHQARELIRNAELESATRDAPIPQEVQNQFDRIMAEVDRLDGQACRSGSCRNARRAPAVDPVPDLPGARMAQYRSSPSYRKLFRHWLATGALDPARIPADVRGVVIGSDGQGGFLAPPVGVAENITRLIDSLCYFRTDPYTGEPNATVELITAKVGRIPQVANRYADFSWTTEVAAQTQDTAMTFSAVDVTPLPCVKLARVSMWALETDARIERFVTEELATRQAQTEEKSFTAGAGTTEPAGLFGTGLDVARDISTGSTTAITADSILAMKFGLRSVYTREPSLAWIMAPAVMRTICQLKDTSGRYLYEPAEDEGKPDVLAGVKVYLSDFAPSTISTGQPVAILGALKHFTIVETAELSIQRLAQLFAATNQVGFIGRRYLNGAVANPNAFLRLRLA